MYSSKQKRILRAWQKITLCSISLVTTPYFFPINPTTAHVISTVDNQETIAPENSFLQANKSRNKIRRSNKKKPEKNQAAQALELAIGVVRNADNLGVASSTTAHIVDDRGQVLKILPASQGVYVQPGDNGLIADNQILPKSIWIVPSGGGYVWAGEHWYRGKMRIIFDRQKVLAVNHVHLEQYLYSVVGSEMPSYWNMEALKAQAVAARSYAIARYLRPFNSYFHLGNTEQWQVYKGLSGETNRTHEAVNQTQGQILSHQGGVVESLYAATDDIVINIHKGRGMSQNGAQQLAVQGYGYLQILGNYYPGVSLARLKLK